MELTKLSTELENNIAILEKMIFVVRDNKDRVIMIAAVREAKSIRASIVTFFEKSKKLTHEAHKSVCADEKLGTDRCDVIEREGKRAVNTWDDEQEEIRRKEQAALQAIEDARARKEQERLVKKAEKIKTPERSEALVEEAASIVAPVVQVAEPGKNKGEVTKKLLKWRVTDPNLIPREWFILDEKSITAFVKSTKGNKKIDGIEIYSESILAITI